MKIYTILAIFALSGLFLVGCQESDDSSPTSQASTQTIALKVDGMTWAQVCVAKVRSALSNVPGVTKADVSLPDSAIITGNPDTAALISAVEKAGYKASLR